MTAPDPGGSGSESRVRLIERAGMVLLVAGGLLVGAAVILGLLIAAGVGDNDPDAVPAAGRPAPPSAPASATPQRESVVPRRLLVGTAVTVKPLEDEPRYARETLAGEYNAVTPENEMKWDTIHPAPARYDFRPADAIVDFAGEHDMAVRGHTLVWHRQVPSWVTDRLWTRPQLELVLRDHISRVVGHYRGRIVQWDVVNEAFDNDGRLRDSIWMRVIGPDYIDLAFRWAREADPDAQLFYNDFDLEFSDAKALAVHGLVRGMKARGVPIDGVGIQGHELTVRPLARERMETALQGYADAGFDVAITELDVGINLPTDPAKLAAQATIYANALDACLAVTRCRTFVTWGFTDKHSWIPAELPGFGDALPFDPRYEPKPALDALRGTLAAARR